MESKIIEFRDLDLEESLSFSSCYDFNSSSSLVIFNNNNSEDDNESYIEIALEAADVSDGVENEDDCDDEMELRLSFSSSVLLPVETKAIDLYDSVTSCTSSLSSSSSSAFTLCSSSTDAESQRNQQVESELCSCIMPKSIRSKVEFPAVNRFVNSFTSSFRDSSEIDLGLGDSRSPHANPLDLMAGRYLLF